VAEVVDPTLIVEVAFSTEPFATPVWTDVSAYVTSVSVRRGKARVLDNMQAGVCTITLDNADHRFTPGNTSSPYYPNVLPMRRFRVRAVASENWNEGVWNEGTWGDLFGVFAGFVESWPMAYQGAYAVTTLTGVDGFKPLNLRKLTASYSQELSSERVDAVLDDIGWPADDRDLDVGETTVQAVTLTAANPLEHLLTVAESENGLLFMDRDGRLRFRSRHGLIGGLLDTTNFTFGDGVGEQLYDSVVIQYDDRDVWNEVVVSSQGVAEQTWEDTTSQSVYGQRTLEKRALLLTSESEQLSYAKFLVASYKDSQVRVERAVFEVVDFWDRLLDVDLGDKVLMRAEPEGSDEIEQPSYVEGISWDIGPNGWRLTWDVVALTRRAYFWVLGDPIQGRLGITTTLAY
jgi:hypothetical protein